MEQQILLNDRHRPRRRALASDVDWLCHSFGIPAGRDTEHISPRIVRLVIEAPDGVTSDELARALDIEQQRVLYHLRGLIRTGLLVRRKRHVMLRRETLERSIRELQRDADRIFENLREVASGIDEELR